MSDAYGPSGGAVLRRALVLMIGCGAVAYAVPRFVLGTDSISGGGNAIGNASPPVAPPQRAASRSPAANQDMAAASEDSSTIFDSTLTYRAGAFNQFFVRASVNGIELPFVIDTGASMVSLKAEDAEAIGINLASLQWNVGISTANGNALAAAITLSSIRLDRITEYNVPAIVMPQKTAAPSLLGMTFLSRLKSWQINDGVLTIRY